MAEDFDSRGGEMEVTPEEERFLKRFFRRQILPWFTILVVIAVTSAWAFGGGDDGAALEARTSAALAQLRGENQRLRQEIGGLSERVDTGLARDDSGANELERRVEDAKRSVRAIESRVSAALERRLNVLEAKLGGGSLAGPVPLASRAPPPDASAWDVSAILDRLYALEMRQEQQLAARDASDRDIGRLEARVVQLEKRGALPASPSR